MNFVFLSPNFPENYWQFCHSLRQNKVSTYGVGDAPYNELDEKLKNSLDDYYQVSNLENYDEVYRAIAYFTHKYGRIDMLESNNEYWLERDARLRTDFNIKGLNEKTIQGIRYKSKMKAFYEKAGCKVARYHLTSTYNAGIRFVKKVGYPVIVKPDNGMGAVSTYKISNEEELRKFYETSYPTQMIMEEFVVGELLSYDGIANSEKEVIFESANYYPIPVMELVNDEKDTFFYSLKDIPDDLREIGRKVVKAFETNSRFFHCEYFRLTEAKEGLGEVGDLIGLEVNMRPPGGNAPDMMNFARDINVYQLWANMIAYDECYYDMNCISKHCVFEGRRLKYNYKLSNEDVTKKYELALRMNQKGPEALAQAMGDYIFIACFDTMDEVNQFISDVTAKA